MYLTATAGGQFYFRVQVASYARPDVVVNSESNAGVAFEYARPHFKPTRFSARWALALSFSDLITFASSAFVGIEIVEHLHHFKSGLQHGLISAALIIVLQLLLFERLNLYRRSLASSVRDEIYYTTAALVIGTLPLLILFTLVPGLSTSRIVILTSLAISIPLVGGSRAVLHELRSISEKRSPRRIAIVGMPDRTNAAAVSLNAPEGTEILRIAAEDIDGSVAALRPSVMSDLETVAWFTEARDWGCQLLLLTETLPPWLMPVVLAAAAKSNIKVAFAPPRFRVHAYTVALEIDGEQALIVPTQLRSCTAPAQFLKRVFDLAVAIPALVFAAPLLACCAFAIKLESPGSALYRQRRVGQGGRVFDVLKLRSMRSDAENRTGAVWAQRGDPRVTPVGRFMRRCSLDELPQLINVLRGDMSIVGPRPERPEFVQTFRDAIPRYDERHLVRPGITGWAQVNLRRALRPSEVTQKLSYDLFYVEQWSLFLDLYIVTKTAMEVLFHQAA